MNLNPELTLSQQAEDLQRGYAAHTVSLRGFLPDGTRVRPPKADTVRLDPYNVQEGAIVEVQGEFPSAPLFAYLDDIPLEIRTFRNQVSGHVQITLVAPDKSGTVRLVWPNKEVIAEPPLYVHRRPLIELFAVAPEECRPSAELRIPFAEEPVEVHLGGKEIPLNQIKREGGELVIRIPKDAVSGQLLIVTRTKVYQSSAIVRIKAT